MIGILAIYIVWGLKLASVAEQAGLNIIWSKISKDTFLRDGAQMSIVEIDMKVSLCRFPISLHQYSDIEMWWECGGKSVLSDLTFHRNAHQVDTDLWIHWL